MSRIVVDAAMYSSNPVEAKVCGGPNDVHRWSQIHPSRYCQCGKMEAYRDAECVLAWGLAEPDVEGRVYHGSPDWN